MDPVTLNVFQGDWGIASIDLDCLIQLTYCKFANAPVEFNFKPGALIHRLPSADLPNKKLRTYDQLTDYLREHNFDPNYHLPAPTKALVLSYQHEIRNCLYPYYALTLYDNEQNFTILRRLYGKRIRFPFSLFYPGKLERHVKEFKDSKYGIVLQDKDGQDAHQKATIDARIFLNTMARKLGDQKYFFGSKPTEFDAHLYAYLAILLHIKLPDNPIQSHIAQCPNLVSYVKRITQQYFAEEAFDSKTVYEFSYVPDQDGTDGVKEEKRKERMFQILAGLFAVGLMGAYVTTSGILESGIFNRRLEHIGYDDDDAEDNDDDD